MTSSCLAKSVSKTPFESKSFFATKTTSKFCIVHASYISPVSTIFRSFLIYISSQLKPSNININTCTYMYLLNFYIFLYIYTNCFTVFKLFYIYFHLQVNSFPLQEDVPIFFSLALHDVAVGSPLKALRVVNVGSCK